MMNEWNSFKRVEAAFNHEIPDRVPKYEGSIEIKELNPPLDGQASPMALLILSPQQLNLLRKVPPLVGLLKKLINHPRLLHPLASIAPRFVSKLHRDFNYDLFDYIPGIPMIFTERLIRDFYTEEKNTVIKHISGRMVWRVSLTGAHARYGFIQSPTEWDKYLEFDADHLGNYFLTEAALKTGRKLDIVPLFSIWGAVGFEELCNIFGFEKIFELLIRDKTFIKAAVKEMNDYAFAVVEKILQRGGKYIYIGSDLGYTGRSLISPQMFRELFKPGMKRICKRVHSLGGKIMFHSCGNIVKMLPDLVETGIDALHPIEKTAGNDIVDFKQKYGKKLTLVGNVPIPLLTHGTPKENYEYVKYLLKNVSYDGGHIISSSHSVTQWCKLTNFLAYYKAVEDWGKYPIDLP
ncbi:MAG: hypothetical protein EU536_01355 [Promethearchaeota archaeon]|nr:MAG: hypothetical protein EU536_01355 [Candidatus Lokiarchaeota archaeon]